MAFQDIEIKRNFADQAVLNKFRSDKFQIIFSYPECINDRQHIYPPSLANKQLVLSRLVDTVISANIPSINIPSIGVPQYGQVINITSHVRPAYENLNVSFFIDSELLNYFCIWKWMSFLNNPRTSFDTNLSPEQNPQFLRNYGSNITIALLNEYNQVLCFFKYIECFPISMSGFQLSMQNVQEQRMDVSFAYSQLLFEFPTSNYTG